MLAFGLALVGAVTLWLPAFRFRIDAVTCATWPALGDGALYALAYVVAVALLAVAWLRITKHPPSLTRVLVLGTIVHATALIAPPFASNDPLNYAAIGRAQAQFHAAASTRLSSVLPPHDRFLDALPPAWREGTSPYGPAFNALARTVARAAGDDLTLQLRLYQVLGALSLLLAALLIGHAADARAAALVLFCPVAIVDGTINPHNDALLAPWLALFALALARKKELPALAAAGAALALKLSAALVFGFELLRLALRPVAARLRLSRVMAVGAVAAAVAVATLVIGMQRIPALNAFTAIIGDAHETYPHFARSLEGLPRAYLHYVAHQPMAAWILGLMFRAASGLWLLYAALRAAREDAPLPWAATAVLIYYLFFHAYMQTWYLIPLLPLAGYLPARLMPPFFAFAIGMTLYYALAIPLDCDARPSVVGAKEFFSAAISLLVPYALMLRARFAPRAIRASA